MITRADLREARRRHDAGESWSDIARAMGHPPAKLRLSVKEAFNLPDGRSGGRSHVWAAVEREGWSGNECSRCGTRGHWVGARHPCTAITPRGALYEDHYRPHNTEAVRREAAAAAFAGESTKDLGARYGVTSYTITRWMKLYPELKDSESS